MDSSFDQDGPHFQWPQQVVQDPQAKNEDTNRVIATVKNLVSAYMKNYTNVYEDPIITKTIKSPAHTSAPTNPTTILSTTTLNEMFDNNSTILQNPEIFEMTNNNGTILTEIMQSNNTILTEMIDDNNTIIRESAEGGDAGFVEMGAGEGVNIIVNSTEAITTRVSNVVTVTTEKVTESINSVISQMHKEDETTSEDHAGDIEDKTLYIVVGVMLCILALIIIILLVIYKRYKYGLNCKTRTYCVKSQMKSVDLEKSYTE